jgi:hypothetical protein
MCGSGILAASDLCGDVVQAVEHFKRNFYSKKRDSYQDYRAFWQYSLKYCIHVIKQLNPMCSYVTLNLTV